MYIYDIDITAKIAMPAHSEEEARRIAAELLAAGKLEKDFEITIKKED